METDSPDPVAERTELLSSTSRVLRSLEVADNLDAIARLVVPYLGDWAMVALLTDEGDRAGVGSWHVDEARRAEVAKFAATFRQPMDAHAWSREVIRTRQPLLVDDALPKLRERLGPGRTLELVEGLGPRFVAMVPMVAGDVVVGVLAVFGARRWTAEQQAMAGHIADRAALALDHAVLFSRERQARRYAELVSERLLLLAGVSDVLAGAEDPYHAIGELADLVVPALADYCFATVLDDDGRPVDIGVGYRDPAHRDLVRSWVRWRTAAGHPVPVTEAMAAGEPVLLPALTVDESTHRPEELDLTRRLDIRSAAVFPLVGDGRLLGTFTLNNTSARGWHSAEELATAREVARRAALVLAAAHAAQGTARLVQSIQRSLLATLPPARGLQVATRYRPGSSDQEAGGDWYDVFATPDGSTTITLGDVMGHDAKAMVAMAQMRIAMRTNAWTLRHSPAAILAATDRMLVTLGPRVYATAFLGELRPPAADGAVRLTWSSAGHPPPVLLARGAPARVLAADRVDVALCVAPDRPRSDHDHDLGPGDTLVLYSDGLVEQAGRDIDDGIDALCSTLEAVRDAPLEELLDIVLGKMLVDGDHTDDAAVLAVRVTGR